MQTRDYLKESQRTLQLFAKTVKRKPSLCLRKNSIFVTMYPFPMPCPPGPTQNQFLATWLLSKVSAQKKLCSSSILQTEYAYKIEYHYSYTYIPSCIYKYIFFSMYASIRCEPSFSCYSVICTKSSDTPNTDAHARTNTSPMAKRLWIDKMYCCILLMNCASFLILENLLEWTCFANRKKKENQQKESFKIIKTYGKWLEMRITKPSEPTLIAVHVVSCVHLTPSHTSRTNINKCH